ncbi:MAG: hypothetical protein ACREDZ_00300, partial [Kiloniellales bacterium]
MLAEPIGIGDSDSSRPSSEAAGTLDLVVAFWEADSRTQLAQPSLPRGRAAPGEAAEDGAPPAQEGVDALITLDLQQLLDRIDEALARQQAGGGDGAGQDDETLSLAILLAALFPEADSLAELEALLKAELQRLAEQPAEALSDGSVLVAAHAHDPIAELVEHGLATLEGSELAEGFGVRRLEDSDAIEPVPDLGEQGGAGRGTGGSVYSDLRSDVGSGPSDFGETLRFSGVLSGIGAPLQAAPDVRRYDGGDRKRIASAEDSAPASHAPVASNDSYAKTAHLFEASF